MSQRTLDICRSSSSANGALLVASKLSAMGRSSCAAAVAAVTCAGRVDTRRGLWAGHRWGSDSGSLRTWRLHRIAARRCCRLAAREGSPKFVGTGPVGSPLIGSAKVCTLTEAVQMPCRAGSVRGAAYTFGFHLL